MWEAELTDKFQQPYVMNWSKGFSTHMYHLKADGKIDDGQVTPKYIDEKAKPTNLTGEQTSSIESSLNERQASPKN